jgi:predicted nucleic acid-binding protein
MILDTTFLIDLTHRDAAALAKAKEIDAAGVPARIPTPALFELWRGVHLAKQDQSERARVLALLAAYTTAPLDADAARRAGEVDAAMVRAKTPVDPEDAMIAGIALAVGEPVLSRNVKHFGRMPGVRVETY